MKLISLPDNSKELLRNALLQQIDALLAKPNTASVNLKADIQDLVLQQQIPKDQGKALLRFTADAFTKLWLMTQEHTQEVAAHALVKRELSNTFLIYDILLYPQTVSAATVQATDDYGPWLMSLSEAQFEDCKMQIHSHVNMGVTPSAVDNSFYHTLLAQVTDFYIFMIINKRSEMWFNIYDVANNLLYESADIEYDLITAAGTSVIDWLDEGNGLISKPAIKSYVSPAAPPASGYGNYHDYDKAQDYFRTQQYKDTPPPAYVDKEIKRKPGRPPKTKPVKISKEEQELMKTFDKRYYDAIHD